MSESVRILTYNTQLRSWFMEFGADAAFPPSERASDRARSIANNIITSTHDYDIIALNEVFHEGARQVLIDELSIRYPYAITKADVGSIEGIWQGKQLPLEITWWDFWFNYQGGPKFEDSGLMLFSRWPFELKDHLKRGISVRPANPFATIGFPNVQFLAYYNAAGHDGSAAKGLLHVVIEREGGRRYHVFASHTQADDHNLDENEGARRRQMVDEALPEVVEALGEITPSEVFMVGDLNIYGGQEYVAPPDEVPERDRTGSWRFILSANGRFRDYLVDMWGSVQCPGGPSGLSDPGTTAPAIYMPAEQRLDYFLQSKQSQLVAQHLYVDYDVAAVPPGMAGVSYLSDHRPLGCDLNEPQPHCCPSEALPVAIPASNLFVNEDSRHAGGVKWLRFAEAGTYDFKVTSVAPVQFAVYLEGDLSRPRQPYRGESTSDSATRYVLPSGPFLVKVFSTKRDAAFAFTLQAAQHTGRHDTDAIDLVSSLNYTSGFEAGVALPPAGVSAPWDTNDSRWFRVDAPRAVPSGTIQFSLRVMQVWPADPLPALVINVGRLDTGALNPSAEATLVGTSATLSWSALPGARFLVAVRRPDPGGPARRFDIRLTSDTVFLLGGKIGTPRIMCMKETAGWGSDDIALRIEADGELVRNITNAELGDMDQEDVRDLDQWISPTLGFRNELVITVTEEDVTTSTVGVGRIPAVWVRDPDLVPLPLGVRESIPSPDGSMRIRLVVEVGDGIYEFRATLTRWHEAV